LLALASVLGVGEGHLLHRETRWVGSRYFAKSESLFQSFPKVSFLAEFPVTWIDRNVERNGTADVAREYLEYLYSEEAQRLIAGFNYRVHDQAVQAEFADRFPELELLPIEEIAGDWETAMTVHFGSGGKLDQLQRR
jgi:sulfate transport system substrate-binding protein